MLLRFKGTQKLRGFDKQGSEVICFKGDLNTNLPLYSIWFTN